MAGIIAVDTIQNGSGASVPTTTVINGSAKAWVNFNGNVNPATITQGFNVSSVTVYGTGSYGINFAVPMATANYVLAGCMSDTNGSSMMIAGDQTSTTTQARIYTKYQNTWYNYNRVMCVFFD